MSNKRLEEAIEDAECLTLKKGLQALKKTEGKDRISCANLKALLGSVNIDDDCRAAYPNASRWDYLVAIGSGKKLVVHYIEVHTASTSQVSKLEEKLQWLKDFVIKQEKLSKLDAKYYWVASGSVHIPKHTRQYRLLNTTLRRDGLVWADAFPDARVSSRPVLRSRTRASRGLKRIKPLRPGPRCRFRRPRRGGPRGAARRRTGCGFRARRR